MAKRILNLHRTLLFTAALAAVAAPALAVEPDIQKGQVCEKKVKPNSWHVCGAAPATGNITFTNTGPHDVTVFTTGPLGVGDDLPAGAPACDTAGYVGEGKILQCSMGIKPDARVWIAMEDYQLFYIARADHMLTDRTIAVTFDEVPGS
jgi:hypothetical protein